MITNPVESSNVSRIGFRDGVIRVQFRNGHTYDYPASEQEYLALRAAPSKGRWIAANLKARQPTVREKESAEQTEPGAAREHAQARAVLQTHAADPCCAKHLAKALRAGSLDTVLDWQCPQCGTDWHAAEANGVRHWEPDAVAMVLRI